MLQNLQHLCATLPQGEAEVWLQLEGTFQFTEPNEEGAHLLSAAQIYTTLKSKHPSALQDCTLLAFSKLLAQVGKRVHTKHGNGYWVKPIYILHAIRRCMCHRD